jgi:hypothetical protein
MFITYLILFFAGMFVANAVPHFTKGVTAQKFRTPFGRPSSAVVNVLWGSANFILGFLLLHFSLARPYNFAWAMVAFFAGFILLGASMADLWSREDLAKEKGK